MDRDLRTPVIATNSGVVSLAWELPEVEEYDRITEKAADYIERSGIIRANRRPSRLADAPEG